MMSEENFDEHILADKLNKLNSSQQSIESLSRWCISHRKKAKQIVETWDKLFKSVQREQRVSFLYLANDILQNSRRKGSEFVNEYWKVLPAALKHVYEGGGDYGKKAASRLVDIWEERKVFGSRGQNLKDEMLGKNPPPLVSNGKGSNSIKIVKRDANSLRIKLAVGGMPEKIVTAFQSVHDENVKEEGALSKCRDAVHRVGEMEKDVENKSSNGNLQGLALVDEILEQENVLRQCVGQLEGAEASRVALASQLKEALQDQELKLELIRTELQVARSLIEQAVNMRRMLTSAPLPASSVTTTSPPLEAMRVFESSLPSNQLMSPLPPPAQPVISFSSSKNSEDENKKAAAAAVAAKLAASTSSAQMLTSVLSSLVAEEAASMRSGFSSTTPMFSPEKRQKLEKAMPVSDVNSSDVGNVAYFTSLQPQPLANVQLTPSTTMQALSQTNQMQGSFLPPPPPPPPPVPPSNSPVNQFVQSSGLVMGVMPYGYGGSSLPAAPVPPSHIAMGLARPDHQPSQPPQTQQVQQSQQQQAANGGYYRPPGIGFYGQSHQPTPPPLPRQ